MGKKYKGPEAWVSSDIARSLLALIVVMLALNFWKTTFRHDNTDATILEQAHINWILSHDAIVHVKVGKACTTCPRGLIATRDFKPAGLILRIPETALIKFPYIEHSAFAAEYARDFVHRMYTNASFNATYGPYLATLPTESELFTPEMWQTEHVSMLQTPALETLAEYARRSIEEIYYGTFPEQPYSPVSELIGGENVVNLKTFKWASAVISSRYLAAPIGDTDEDDEEVPTRILAPLLDFANHADEAHQFGEENAYQTVFDGAVQLRAKRLIKKGEEIKFNYQPGVVHRPDMSLLAYGFFQKTRASDTKKDSGKSPLLCSVDLPTFSLEVPYEPTPESDDTFYGPKGTYNTVGEYHRLQNLLNEAPTTLEQDELALKVSWSVLSDIEKLLIEFRIERKRGLIAAMENIKNELGEDSVGHAEL